jgi:preprotein translocase subunit SecG
VETFVWIVHILTALVLVGFVLMQHGKGADVGAAFGSGASGSLFGARGAANFLSHTTAILAVVFFVTSLTLTYLSATKREVRGVMEGVATQSAPAAPPQQTPTVPVPVPGEDTGSKAKDIPK